MKRAAAFSVEYQANFYALYLHILHFIIII